VVSGTLRRDHDELSRFVQSAAELFVRGVWVDWASLVPGPGRRVVLPTYPFQRQRFWLEPGASVEVSGAGLESVEHPVLGAVTEVPASDGVVVSGRVSLGGHPWLADHAVSGVVLVPGAALVEWAIQAGDRVGCSVVEELVIESPMGLPGSGVLRVQVSVGELDQIGRRPVGIYSRPEGGDPLWTRHASGYLSSDTPVGQPGSSGEPADAGVEWGVWPPAGAHPVDVDEFYDRLTERGYQYGPVFQGLTAGWARGPELFAEVALPEQADPHGFAIHPALFDAALHTALLTLDTTTGDSAGGSVVVPFVWNRVVLHASGATVVRVRVRAETSGVSVELADPSGAPVLSVGSLVSRPIPLEQLTGGNDSHRDALFSLDWNALPDLGAQPVAVTTISSAQDLTALGDTTEQPPQWLVLRPGPDPAGISDPQRARAQVNRVLEVVQTFLNTPQWTTSHLVITTHSGVGLTPNEPVDPAASAVWGLIRSAQTENPDRILLADLQTPPQTPTEALTAVDASPQTLTETLTAVDASPETLTALDASPEVLIGALAGVLGPLARAGEWQFAVRGGSVWVPRLIPAKQDIGQNKKE